MAGDTGGGGGGEDGGAGLTGAAKKKAKKEAAAEDVRLERLLRCGAYEVRAPRRSRCAGQSCAAAVSVLARDARLHSASDTGDAWRLGVE